MKEPEEKTEEEHQKPIFEPFPVPNTMPSGWDLSGLIPDTLPVYTTPTKEIVASFKK